MIEKSGPTLVMTPDAEDGVAFNSVPSTEHDLQFRTHVFNATASFFQKLSN